MQAFIKSVMRLAMALKPFQGYASKESTMQNIEPYTRNTKRLSATILVAEDDAVFRTVFARELQERGHTVLSAENGAEAMTIANDRTRAIDILITDYFMPDFNGRELADRMLPLQPQIKVLYMTAYMARLVPILSDFENCAGSIFAKPIAPEHLDEVIQAMLAGRFKSAQKS